MNNEYIKENVIFELLRETVSSSVSPRQTYAKLNKIPGISRVFFLFWKEKEQKW